MSISIYSDDECYIVIKWSPDVDPLAAVLASMLPEDELEEGVEDVQSTRAVAVD